MVIDPGTRVPELDCFNRIARHAPIPCTHHLPALQGSDSLWRVGDGVAGIVILGSGASVHDNLAWQSELDQWLLPMLERDVPALGLCYGHQHLAHRLGGEVGFLFDDRTKLRGTREVAVDADRMWGEARTGRMVISHREVVTRLPQGFETRARDEVVAIDAFAHPTRPIWGFQPHPEATTAFTTNNGIPFDEDPAILTFGHGYVDAFSAFVAGQPAPSGD